MPVRKIVMTIEVTVDGDEIPAKMPHLEDELEDAVFDVVWKQMVEEAPGSFYTPDSKDKHFNPMNARITKREIIN